MELATATAGPRKGARWWKAEAAWREQRLRQRIGEGHRYDEIASELGCTLGMVCGKADRMQVGRGAEKRSQSILWPRNQDRSAMREPDPAFLGIGIRQRQEASYRQGRTVHLEQLEDHHCRFVIGDPTAKQFCGVRRHGRSSYCAEHASRCSGAVMPEIDPLQALTRSTIKRSGYGVTSPINTTSSRNMYMWPVNTQTLEVVDDDNTRAPAPA